MQASGEFESSVAYGGSTPDARLWAGDFCRIAVGPVDGGLYVRGKFNSETTVGSPSNIRDANVRLDSIAGLDVEGHIHAGNVTIGLDSRVSVESYSSALQVISDDTGRLVVNPAH